MKELYTRHAVSRWRMRTRRALAATGMAAALALACCIYLCTQVSTATAESLLYLVIGLSILGGWAVMLLTVFAYLPARAERDHIAGMLAEEAAELTGVLTIEKQKWYIPHSIAFCNAAIVDADGRHALRVNARLLKQLPPSGTAVRAIVQRKFITAYEVQP